MREESRISRGVVEIGSRVPTYGVVASGVNTHTAFGEFTLINPLEAGDVVVVLNQT